VSWTDFTRLVEAELQTAGLQFDQYDLIAFIECNHGLIDDASDPLLCAKRFAAIAIDGVGVYSTAPAGSSIRRQASDPVANRLAARFEIKAPWIGSWCQI